MQIFPYSMTLDLPVTQSLIKITSELNVGGGGGWVWAGARFVMLSFWFLVSGFLFLVSVFSLLVPGSGFCGFWFLISVF